MKEITFGNARDLYEKGIHPRVVFGPDEMKMIKIRNKYGVGSRIARGIAEIGRDCLRKFSENRDYFTLLTSNGSAVASIYPIAETALIYQDSDCLELLREVFHAVCTEPKTEGFLKECKNNNSLFPDILHAFFPIYDWFYDLLSYEAKHAYRVLAKNISSFVVEKQEKSYFLYPAHNTPMISTLSCIPVILSVYRDDPEISIESELQCLLRFFDASIHSAIGIDGYPVEDIGYGTSMLCFLGQLAEFLFRAGFYNAYANRRFLNAGNAILHFVQPWGQFLSNTGDHGDDINNRLPLLVNLSRHTGKKELLWLASTLYYNRNLIGGLGGWNPIGFFDEIVVRKTVHLPRNLYSLFYFNDIMQKRVHPEKLKVPTSFADRQTGIVSFRSGWGKNDTMVVFHGSQRSSLAEGHQHASCGHFSISSHGEYFAIDTGRYNMEQSCHNVVLINGKSGESTGGNWRAVRHHGVLLEYQPGKFVDYAAVDSSHQHNCYWAKRFLGMVKGNAYSYVWIVDDINYNDGSAEFVWQLHTAYGNQIEINDKKATITGFRYGNRMDIHWVIPDDWPYDPYTIKVEQDIAFPSSYKYLGFDPDENPSEILKKLKKIALTGFQKLEDMVHGPVYFRPRVFARIHGANGRFISFLIPYFANSHPPQLIKLKTVPNAFAVKIMWDKFEDTVIFSYGHNILETEDIAARGQWCVVRRNKRKKIINYALKDGEYLKIGGKNYRV